MQNAPASSQAMPATLKDVARLAGVSLATVDRVLHGRAGVKPMTVRRVKEVVDQLDFRPLAAAAQLARSRRLRFCFVMPGGQNPFMGEIIAHVHGAQGWLAARRISAEVIDTDVFDAVVLAKALHRLIGVYDGVAVVALDHPLVREALDDLVAAGMMVVTLISDVPTSRRHHFVGIDNLAAGRTAASLLGRFIGDTPAGGAVAVIVGSLALRDHAERVSGFSQVMARDYPHLTPLAVLEGRDDSGRNAALCQQILRDTPRLLGIYNAGAGNAGIVQCLAAHAMAPLFVGHELVSETRQALIAGVMAAVVHQDPGHQARSATRVLYALATGEQINPAQEKIRLEIIMRDNLP